MQRAQRPRLSLDDALAATAARPARSGFLLDFDGTIAPIQLDPESVRPVPGAVEALGRLAPRVGRLAIVSARPVAFLEERLGSHPGLTLHGLYGLETRRPGGGVVTHPGAAASLPAVREAVERARSKLPPGVRVEDKRLSVALHYRGQTDLGPEVEAWARRQAEELGLRAQRGRMVMELKPAVDRDKGSVCHEETEGLACAWYFGDDLSDARAFAALAERESADAGFVGVRVAVANPETGAGLAEAADLVVDRPEAVPALLDRVAAALPG